MRDFKPKKTDKKHDVRLFLNKMRTYLNEDVRKLDTNDFSDDIDQKREEEKFMNNFSNDEVTVDFLDLEVNADKIFWGGTIKNKNGSLDWVYLISNENTDGFIVNEESKFDLTIPENKQIFDKLKIYYDTFFKYWKGNLR
jgi:hypothetical protein